MTKNIIKNMAKLRRIVYKKINDHPICEENPSINYVYKYTNQIFEDGEWKFANKYIGKSGKEVIIWYNSAEWAEMYIGEDYEIDEMVELNEINK